MNLSDLVRNSQMLHGSLSKRGYMRWWHSFPGVQSETGETRTFFVEFFIINPAMGASRPILGQHPYFRKRGMKPSYVMIKAGVFPDEEGNGGRQFHAFYPVSALQATGSPLIMQIDDPKAGRFLYSEDKLVGSMEVTPREARHRSRMTDAGSMEWDINVQKIISCHTGRLGGKFSETFRRLDSFWHGEGILSLFQGSVTVDGVPYEVTPESGHGYADKHWGRSFNRPWFQFACGKLVSERTGQETRCCVVALNCLRPRFLLFPLRPRLMLQLTYRGEDFQFARCKWDTKETGKRFVWHVLAQNRDMVVKLSGSCTKKEMLDLQYEDPSGRKEKQPLWAGAGGIGTLQLYRKTHGGRESIDALKLSDSLCIYRSI